MRFASKRFTWGVYAVECALKALILARTAKTDRNATVVLISRGVKSHDFAYLKSLLRKRSCFLPPEIQDAFQDVTTWEYGLALRGWNGCNTRLSSISDRGPGRLWLGGQGASMKDRSAEIRKIKAVLQQEFPDVAAYRHYPTSIRVRVLDDRFRGMPKTSRKNLLRHLLRQLPEEIQQDIDVLLLLTPAEAKTSPMNFEFEDPSPVLD